MNTSESIFYEEGHGGTHQRSMLFGLHYEITYFGITRKEDNLLLSYLCRVSALLYVVCRVIVVP